MADYTKVQSDAGSQSQPSYNQEQKRELRKKQRESIRHTFSEEDPVSSAVRSLWKKVRG